MVAAAVHDRVDVGAPFYASAELPGAPGVGAPALHKFDRTDFIDRFLGELATAAAGQGTPSLLAPPAPLESGVPDFDTDALDFLSRRFRKLYQPGHFRFYLAACELRCLVPGFPAPARAKIKKIEFVIRRVEITKKNGGSPDIGAEEWAWVTIPTPNMFPEAPPPRSAPIGLSPRLTGNTRTWWPIPSGEAALEGEERFRMTRATAPELQSRAVYFGFLPLASGEMYGPRSIPSADAARTPILGKRLDEAGHERPETIADFIGPPVGSPPALTEAELAPARPLVRAPSNFPLSPASIKGWFRKWKKVLGALSGAGVDGPRPKFESPRLDGDPDGGWGYVVRCVATLEPTPGCIVEQWGPPSPPALIAPHFDPFGGRPTQIEIPSPAAIKKMLGPLLAPDQIARRGGLNVAMKNNGAPPTAHANPVSVDPPNPSDPAGEICFLGFPLITLCAYLMFSIALVIVLAIFPFAIFLRLKFCLPIGPKDT